MRTQLLSLNALPKHLQTRANSIARQYGYGKATGVYLTSKDTKDKVIFALSSGYRKNTTGEYVSSKYRAKFGWKNTYYQNSQCNVLLSVYENTVNKYTRVKL